MNGVEWKGYTLSGHSVNFDCDRVATLLGLLVSRRPIINSHVCKHAFSHQTRVRMTHELQHEAPSGHRCAPAACVEGRSMICGGPFAVQEVLATYPAGLHVRLAVWMCRCLKRATTLWSAYFEVHAIVLCEFFWQDAAQYPEAGNTCFSRHGQQSRDALGVICIAST